VKLSPLQWSWLIAAGLFFAAVLLDVADLIVVPNLVLIGGALSLLVISHLVGPSLKELNRMNRRG
jgi:hypothetical protein